MRLLWKWFGGAASLLVALLAAVGLLKRSTRDAIKAEAASQADADNLATRERIDDATRDEPEPDAARERLQQFGAGTRPPER